MNTHTLALMVGSITFSSIANAYHCPKTIQFTCIKEGFHQTHSLCTLQSNIDRLWNFAAPDKNIGGNNLSAKSNLSGKTSQSNMPPGRYQAEYVLAYYGPITGISESAAYCIYQVQTPALVALAGVFSSQLTKDGSKNWKQFQQGYICQAGVKACMFTTKNHFHHEI